MIECFKIEEFVICQMFRPYMSGLLPGDFQSEEYCKRQEQIEKKLRKTPEYIIELLEAFTETKRRVFEKLNRFGGVKFYRYLDMECDVVQYVQSELPKYQITMEEKIKQLQKMTDAGMMDCKKALEETNGDISKSRALLQKKSVEIWKIVFVKRIISGKRMAYGIRESKGGSQEWMHGWKLRKSAKGRQLRHYRPIVLV